MLWIPSAATVPKTVARTDAATAIITVFTSERRMSSLLKSLIYQSKVKPVQLALDLEALNENTIRTSIGRYRKMYRRYI